MRHIFSWNPMRTMSEDKLKIDSTGGAIRALRETAGLSLAELAEKVGWDKGRLSKYENNHLGLSLSVIDEIAAALGLASTTVLISCIKHRYPHLSRPRSRVGKLLDQLDHELHRST